MPNDDVPSVRLSLDSASAKPKEKSNGPLARVSRYYQAPVPCTTNIRAFNFEWDTKSYKKHRLAVATAKFSINNTAPRMNIDHKLNLNKLQNTEYRLTTMERDNMVLLAKMSHLYRNLSVIKSDQNVEKLEIIKTCGKLRMIREFISITAENHAILEEVNAAKTIYSRAAFLKQYEDWKKKVEMNSRYPVTWDKYGVPHYVPPPCPDTRYLQTLLTPLNKRHLGYRRALPGEVPMDRLGRPFIQTHKRAMMSLVPMYRYHTGESTVSLPFIPESRSQEEEGQEEEVEEEEGQKADIDLVEIPDTEEGVQKKVVGKKGAGKKGKAKKGKGKGTGKGTGKAKGMAKGKTKVEAKEKTKVQAKAAAPKKPKWGKSKKKTKKGAVKGKK